MSHTIVGPWTVVILHDNIFTNLTVQPSLLQWDVLGGLYLSASLSHLFWYVYNIWLFLSWLLTRGKGKYDMSWLLIRID